MTQEAVARAPERWRGIFPLALAGLLVLGIGDAVLGVLWPSMRSSFGQPLAALGEVGLAQLAGYLAASGLSGWLSTRLGTGRYLALAAATGTMAMVGFALASVWPLFVLSGAVYGLWAGSIDPGINSWMALIGRGRAMNLVHFAYGVGATAGPLLATVALTLGRAGRNAYIPAAAGTAALLLGFMLTREAWGRPPRPWPRAGRPDAVDPFPWLVLAGILVTFIVYVGIEVGTGVWTYSHLVGLGTPQGLAGVIVSVYWGALTAGRLLLAAFGGGFGAARVALGSCLIALAGAIAYVVVPAGAGALVGLALLGLGFAGIFPALMTLVPARVGAGRTPNVVGAILGASATGASLVSAGIGLGMQAAGVWVLPWFVLAGAVVLLAVNAATDRLSRP